MKQNFFNNKQFNKYLTYALGEMVLVVIGILIALQIDNWNTDKQEKEALDNYLNSIAGNMASDLLAVNAIRAERELAAELSYRQNYITGIPSFSPEETAFAHRAMQLAQEIRFFSASTSGFEALKSSGNLDLLQGTDLETLLYDYYGTVSRVIQAEKNHNDYLRALWLQMLTGWPPNLQSWEMSAPTAVSTERLQAMQPAMRELFRSNSANALHRRVLSAGPIIRDYERLNALGTAFIHLVGNGSMVLDADAAATLVAIGNQADGVGYPDLFTEGQLALHSYFLGTADSNDSRFSGHSPVAEAEGRVPGLDFNFMQRMDDSLQVNYLGGADWAGIWLFAGSTPQAQQTLDFSKYDRLVLELKGAVGGEEVLVNIEDVDDPGDGTSTRYVLQLSDQWQTYEIDLDEFETADFSKLRAVLGFVFLQQAQSFSIRNARYVAND